MHCNLTEHSAEEMSRPLGHQAGVGQWTRPVVEMSFGQHPLRTRRTSCQQMKGRSLLIGARRTLHGHRRLQVQSSPGAASAGTGPPEVVLILAQNYYALQNPALLNKRYYKALEEFTRSAVLAYECGHNEQDVEEQLGVLCKEELSGLRSFDAADCLALVCLVWITLMLAPGTVRRWATASPVSPPTLGQWRGFVSMIVSGYFDRRMAWFPLDRLQLELKAVQDRSLSQELVAERARLVFTTLEQVYPQFATD